MLISEAAQVWATLLAFSIHNSCCLVALLVPKTQQKRTDDLSPAIPRSSWLEAGHTSQSSQ